MRLGTKANFYFSSRALWAALLISIPWFLLASFGSINPHRDWSGIPCALSGLSSLALLAYSWSRGERQMLFLLIVFIFAALTAVLPLVDAGNSKHDPRSSLDARTGLCLHIGGHWPGASESGRYAGVTL
jgi:hypothetical protein